LQDEFPDTSNRRVHSSALLLQEFRNLFPSAPQVIASAPGRVEFVGNHTDYNGGAVLGVAIDRRVTVVAAKNAPGQIRLRSTSGAAPVQFTHAPSGRLTGQEAWANYILGAWNALNDHSLPRPAGFDLLVDSDLPAGAGLSSSAALELATLLALTELAEAPTVPPEALARLGRHAENKYVGVPCGILDQGTSAFGEAGSLVHIDCRGPHFSRVPLPGSAHLWIFNTRDKHALIDGCYAERHRECTDAARLLQVEFLTDLTPAQLAAAAGRLPETLARRARHVVEEHARVADTVGAFQRGDLRSAGLVLTASHRSSQHLFENSTQRLDRLVDALAGHPAVYGARLTGGGFGGAVMALTTDAFTAADAAAIAAIQQPAAEVLHLQSAAGARVDWRA
jgi:galactokinase